MKFIEHLEGLISSNVKFATALLSLVKLEAQLAALSVFPLLITLCMLLIVFMSLWLTAMTLLGYGLIFLLGNFVWAILCLLAINIIFMLLVLYCLKANLRKMSFENTRECLSKNKRSDHYEIQKTNTTAHFSDEKSVVKSTD